MKDALILWFSCLIGFAVSLIVYFINKSKKKKDEKQSQERMKELSLFYENVLKNINIDKENI